MSSTTFKLNNGREMPKVGFGLWKVGNDMCAEQVYNAIKAGYRLFDGACDYGNEVEAGKGVARAIKEGLVKREELFLVSKLWCSYHDREQVEPICRKQLADWDIDYFDLFLIHFPIALKYVDPKVRYPPGWQADDGKSVIQSKATNQETWEAMEQLVSKGLAKSIGISNYSGSLINDLRRYAKITPQSLQVEHHPYLVQQDLIDYAQSLGIVVTAYSSFGPQSFMEMDMAIHHAKKTPPLLQHSTVTGIAQKHNVTPAQVLLRWATQRNVAVIPKTNNPARLKQNLDVTGWDLTSSELNEISALDQDLRFNFPDAHGVSAMPIFA